MLKTILTSAGIVIITDEDEYLYPNGNIETIVTYQKASGFYIAKSSFKTETLDDGDRHGPECISKDLGESIIQAQSALAWLKNAKLDYDRKTNEDYVRISDIARIVLERDPSDPDRRPNLVIRDDIGAINTHIGLSDDIIGKTTKWMRAAYEQWQNRRTIAANKKQ